MHRNVACVRMVSAVVGFCLSAAPALAQVPGSAISGSVTDTSEGALPGVTVEAASPTLIEGSRIAVTDGEGRYSITGLRPGTYTVTFGISGFATVIREGVELTSGFTANINAAMQVGSVAETITVTGATPQVDVQNVRQQTVITSTVLDSLPVGQGSTASFVALIPGLTDAGRVDVGGSGGHWESGRATYGRYHGKHGLRTTMDGMRTQNTGTGQAPGYTINVHFVEEVAVSTGGITAEGSSTSMAMNHIVKEGSNNLTFMVAGRFMTDAMQGDNLSNELIERGATTPAKLEDLDDIGAYVGGPLMPNKLWFYGGVRRWGFHKQVPGLFENLTLGTNVYTEDLSKPVTFQELNQSYGGRLTLQATETNKIGFFVDYQSLYGSGGFAPSPTNAPEAQNTSRLKPSGIVQGTWTHTPTNRLLLEAGAGWMVWHHLSGLSDGVDPLSAISIVEQSTGRRYNAPGAYYGGADQNDPWVVDRFTERASVSYVTGTHNFKAGVQVEQGIIQGGARRKTGPNGGALEYRFNNGLPNRLTQSAEPYVDKAVMSPDLGLFVQDQWAIDRLTLNLGLRFDYWNGYIPEQTIPATRFLPERHYDKVENVPRLMDINPRLGASYDLSGNGRTALKVSMGRYSDLTGLFYTQVADPARTSIRSVTRSWNDANANFSPDCELTNFGANGECGPISNSNFGQLNPRAVQFAPEVMEGFNARKYTWDIASEVQHELARGLSMTAGYYYNWDGNIRALANEAVTAADFDPYSITTPVDPGLPGGGGQVVSDLFNISPDKFGQFDEIWRQSDNFGDGSRRNSHFVAFSMDARLPSGIRIGGGVDTGKTQWDNCFTTDNPQQATIVHITAGVGQRAVEQRFCHEVQSWLANLQVKLNGTVPLPADFTLSGSLVNVAGQEILANYSATTDQIAPSLGRPLSGGARTALIPLIEPYSKYEGRRAMLDLRLSRVFDLGSAGRLDANVDLYNVFNANTIMARIDTYGPRWGQPTSILPARMVQVGARLSF